jgi:hypothetical protein
MKIKILEDSLFTPYEIVYLFVAIVTLGILIYGARKVNDYFKRRDDATFSFYENFKAFIELLRLIVVKKRSEGGSPVVAASDIFAKAWLSATEFEDSGAVILEK